MAHATVSLREPAYVTPTGPLNRTLQAGGSTLLGFDLGSYIGPDGPSFYQWLFNGKVLGNSTENSLSLNNVRASSAGFYSLQITNSAGKANAANWVVALEQSGVLVYTLKGTGFSTSGHREMKRSISGLLVVDEVNQNAAIIITGGKAGVDGYNQLIEKNEVSMHSTGPIKGSRTVISGSIIRDLDSTDDNGTEEIESLWISGLDSVVKLSSSLEVVAPKSLKGFMATLSLDNTFVPSIEEYSINLSLDMVNTLNAANNSETLSSAVARIRSLLNNQGFTSIDNN
jgi:hypothetical protein